MNKKIANIVFYKFWDPTREEPMQQACIFYEDGSVENTTYEEGIETAYAMANVENFTKQQFHSILNNERIYTLSGSEFERRFKEFIGKEAGITLAEVAEAVNANMLNIEPTEMKNPIKVKTNGKTLQPKQPSNLSLNKNGGIVDGSYHFANTNNRNRQPASTPSTDEATEKQIAEEVQRILNEKRANANPVVKPKPGTTAAGYSANYNAQTNPTGSAPIPPIYNPTYMHQAQPVGTNNPVEATGTDPYTVDDISNKKKNKKKKKSRKLRKKRRSVREWAKNALDKIKSSKIGRRVTALFVSLALILGIGGYKLAKNSKTGNIINNRITAMQQVDGNEYGVQDQDYNKLLKKTKNEDLKAIMTKQGQNLDMYNRDFAADYTEKDKNVKAALTWDEVIALNLAYNDYTPEQIRLMFNGSNVDSLALSNAYKNAQLQLMGAYVISDRDTPVNTAGFINSDEGQKFVQKYENLFYNCKEATGDARVEAVNNFYKELAKDFPINNNEREVGLSHADSRNKVKNYMAAVAPMVAASEIMWQNLAIDHTLSSKATAYFNDIGLCNIAEDAFKDAETITLTAEVNKKVPTYQEFMETKMTELAIEQNNVIDDAHRDLSKLAAFQEWVNGHFIFDQNGNNTGKIDRSSTYTDTKYGSTTTTHITSDRKTAVQKAGEDAVSRAEAAVNSQIDQENAANKAQAEADAERKRQELQSEADRNGSSLNNQVNQDNQDFQDQVNGANDQINNGGTVNEGDLGHGTDFDRDHSDGNGNLNGNVSGITPDGTGAVDSNTPLPDPNQTGVSFDQRAASNAALVDAMIKEMATQAPEVSPAKVYTK